jgi:CcmD family protein
MKQRTRIVVVFAATLATWLAGSALALAQEFQRVEGAPRQEIPAGSFVSAAYGFIWIAVLAYVVLVARGLTAVRRELAELRGKVERATPPTS